MEKRALLSVMQRRLLSGAAAPAAASMRGKLSVRDVDLKVSESAILHHTPSGLLLAYAAA